MSSRRAEVENAARADGKRLGDARDVVRDEVAHCERSKRCHWGRDMMMMMIVNLCAITLHDLSSFKDAPPSAPPRLRHITELPTSALQFAEHLKAMGIIISPSY